MLTIWVICDVLHITVSSPTAREIHTHLVHCYCLSGNSLDVLLQGQRAEVESMITDMGISQAAVEQLSIFCISLKK